MWGPFTPVTSFPCRRIRRWSASALNVPAEIYTSKNFAFSMTRERIAFCAPLQAISSPVERLLETVCLWSQQWHITYRPTDAEVQFGVGAIDDGITSFFADVAVFHSQLDSSNVALQRLHVYSHREIETEQGLTSHQTHSSYRAQRHYRQTELETEGENAKI